MATAEAASPERTVLRARARGEVSAEAAFEELYRLYGPNVRAFLRLRVGPAADDLMQDVWLIFHHRWLSWEFRPEFEAAEARPILSFLFRTAHFVVKGFRRRSGREEGIEDLEAVDERDGAERRLRDLEAGRCLDLARRVCPAEELDVLLAKLAGVPAREIAATLGVTEPVVDHRFRSALARLQKRMAPRAAKPASARNARGKGGRRG